MWNLGSFVGNQACVSCTKRQILNPWTTREVPTCFLFKWGNLLSQHLFWKCFLNFIYLFIFGCAGSSLLLGLCSSCSELGVLSSYDVQASHCSGFSCCEARARGLNGLQQLWLEGSTAQASIATAHGLGCSEACGVFPDQGWNPHLLRW